MGSGRASMSELIFGPNDPITVGVEFGTTTEVALHIPASDYDLGAARYTLLNLTSGGVRLHGQFVTVNQVLSHDDIGQLTYMAAGSSSYTGLQFLVDEGDNHSAFNVVVAMTPGLNGTYIGTSAADVVDGAAGNDRVDGRAGADLVIGGAGNDRLIGGAGIDKLIGGADKDLFVFSAPLNVANRDVITDFDHAADTIGLENAVFTRLGAGTHGLNPAFLRLGSHAVDANDYVIYSQTSGYLVYDSNGNHAGGMTVLALFANHPALDASDFMVI
jgi:Ca2+-binding RTX toxin-like protein